MKDENLLSQMIISAAVGVHRATGGPGLLESVYEVALVYELRSRGLSVEQQTLTCLRLLKL